MSSQRDSKLDGIIEEIKQKAPFYTPEWRFTSDKPDAGTALSYMWADMLLDSKERIGLMPQRVSMALMNELGAENRPAGTASGYLSFTAADPEAEPLVPAGTKVCAEDDSKQILQTQSSITARYPSLSGIYEGYDNADSAGRLDFDSGADFFKFSSRNNRCLYIEHRNMFSVSNGGVISLRINCAKETGRALEAMTNTSSAVWEYRSRDLWYPIPHVNRYRDNIFLSCPDESLGEVIRLRIKDKASFRGISLSGLKLLPGNQELRPDAVYSGDLPIEESGFFPFSQRFSAYDTVSIACDEALTKPGAIVELSFNTRIFKTEIPAMPMPEQEWKPVMHPDDIVRVEEKEITITSVLWEYFNGTGWNRLPVQGDPRDIFSSGGETEKKSLKFKCPDDIESIAVGAHEKNFIRARILSIENPYALRGNYLSPWMDGLEFKYGFSDGVEPRRLTVAENMTERRYTDFRNPINIVNEIFPEPAVYFRFQRPFSEDTVLFEMSGSDNEKARLKWQYYSLSGWRELTTSDETDGLKKTGLITYYAPEKPERISLFGESGYWIRVVDEYSSYTDTKVASPQVLKIWGSTVRAESENPGTLANGTAKRYAKLISSVRGIASVCNPTSVVGGCPGETDEQTLMRYSRAFSHGNRAVSRRDIEALAYEASAEILRCVCFPNTLPNGEKHERDISLIILSSGSTELEFENVVSAVQNHLKDKLPLGFGMLHIAQPKYVTINVTVTAVIGSLSELLDVRQDINRSLSSFLDPRHGHFSGKGWEIGTLPDTRQLENILRSGKTIKRIKNIAVSYLVGGENIDYRALEKDRFVIPENGKHEIILEVDR